MGKVYEALNKAERERNRSAMAAAAIVKPSRTSKKSDRRRSEEFDFINYSLSAPPAAEIDRLAEEEGAAPSAPSSSSRPAREVALDLARIDPHLVAFYEADPRASEEYNKLAIALIAGAAEQNIKRVLVASAHHSEGRTCVTLNLACALARAKQKVLIVDTDLHRPSILRLLGIQAESGLAEAVANLSPPDLACIRIAPFGFDLLPTRERIDNSAELLASANFQSLLDSVAPEYDFMLFDSAPLEGAGDISLLLRQTDTTLLVIRAGKINSTQMAKAIAPLTEEKLFGVVLNRAAN